VGVGCNTACKNNGLKSRFLDCGFKL